MSFSSSGLNVKDYLEIIEAGARIILKETWEELIAYFPLIR
jgi:hypothetical protein